MKKKMMLSFSLVLGLGLISCTCECIGPDNQNPNDKECKTAYENAYGQGTWVNYEAGKKNEGYICK
jgi:hypothetical protein